MSRAESDALRYAARCAYTLDHHPVSLEQLARRAAFARVGLAKLARWAEQEGWLREREGNILRWRERAEARLRASLLRRTHSQRAMVQSLHDQAVQLRCQQVVQPKSWEQVASVQLKAAALLHQMHREEVQAAATLSAPRAGSGRKQPAEGLPVDLLEGSDEEYQRSAHDLLRKRLSQRLAKEGKDALGAEEHIAAPKQPPNPELSGDLVDLHANTA